MRKSIILTLLLLGLASCTEFSSERSGSEQQARLAKGNSEASDSASANPPLYIHCIGKDVHLRNYQPSVSLSYQFNESEPKKTKKMNEVFKDYSLMCGPKSVECETFVDSSKIIISNADQVTETVTVKERLFIDRISGQFEAARYLKVGAKEVTEYSAIGRCEKSASPTPPTAI